MERRKVFSCGENQGQLGILEISNDTEKVLKPTQITTFSKKIKKIACGFVHTLFLDFDGKVYSTGSGKTCCVPYVVYSNGSTWILYN